MEKEKMTIVNQKKGFVEIEFSDQIPKEFVKEQVLECISETCDCCSTEFRENVTSFKVVDAEKLKIRIFGSITKEQIENNINSCSPKLVSKKETCCSNTIDTCC